jgi:hypothetical protein
VDGVNPQCTLTYIDGYLYGSAAHGNGEAGIIYRMRPDGSDFFVIDTFNGLFPQRTDGYLPQGDLVLVGDSLYDRTFSGGDFNGGTIFALSLPGVPEPGTINLALFVFAAIGFRKSRLGSAAKENR